MKEKKTGELNVKCECINDKYFFFKSSYQVVTAAKEMASQI
jgi:hypothetical protein